jgi:transcriptional regulator with XRE-family HTH domain
MRISSHNTDEAILSEIGGRLARTRLERNLTQAQLAAEAGLAKVTIERMEHGEIAKLPSLIRVLRVLGLLDALDGLVPEPTPSPIERLKLQGKQRQRAGRSHDPDDTATPWTWGDEPDETEQ